MVAISSSAVKGRRRKEDCAEVRRGRSMEERKEAQSAG
jgi:hypothetical protein